MLTLLTVHSWTRWLVLIALVGGVTLAYLRYRSRAEWSPYFHQAAVMVVDVQVAIGVVIWLFFDGWKRTFFFAALHPVAMLLALGVAHVGVMLANRRNDFRSWLFAGVASLLSLLLIVAAIPWERL